MPTHSLLGFNAFHIPRICKTFRSDSFKLFDESCGKDRTKLFILVMEIEASVGDIKHHILNR